MNPPPDNNASSGDFTLMAWPDYMFGYIHRSKAAVAQDILDNDWAGGVNLTVLDAVQYGTVSQRLITFATPLPPDFATAQCWILATLGRATGWRRYRMYGTAGVPSGLTVSS